MPKEACQKQSSVAVVTIYLSTTVQ